MRLVATAFALWLSACSCEAPRGMIVQLRSNFVPGIEFDEARTEVWSDGQRAPYLDTSRAMRWRDPVERGVQIADAAELAPGTYTVIVTLRRAGSAVAQRRVRVSYEGTWAVTVLVTRDCANVTCEDGLTCLAGVCVPQDCLTGSAFDGCPTVVCRQDADCEAPPIDCTDVMCLDGLCHPFPVHDECGDEEWCNPDEGCRVRPDEVRDAGVAPGDAGVPRCDEGCDDANPCTDDDCVAGRCVFAHNSEPCDDGRFCNGPDRCGGGRCVPGTTSPCPGASVCEETVGACTGCATDADCPAETVGGWGQCSFGDTCAADGTRSRTVTRYRCDAGTCAESRSTEMGACARASRDGVRAGDHRLKAVASSAG
ncbi:MAG: hypothetical protein KF729_02715 [Sandaracinaceae bacterium]|nr:hypothetical protein [Sandaracinaceae bacterium]